MTSKNIKTDEATDSSSPTYVFPISRSGTLGYRLAGVPVWEWRNEDGINLGQLDAGSAGARVVLEGPNLVVTCDGDDGPGAYVSDWSVNGQQAEAVIGNDRQVAILVTVDGVPVTAKANANKRRILITIKPDTDLGDATLRGPLGG